MVAFYLYVAWTSIQYDHIGFVWMSFFKNTFLKIFEKVKVILYLNIKLIYVWMFRYNIKKSSFILKYLFYVIKKIFFYKMNIIASKKRSFYTFSSDSTSTKNFHPNISENIKRPFLIKKYFLIKIMTPKQAHIKEVPQQLAVFLKSTIAFYNLSS